MKTCVLSDNELVNKFVRGDQSSLEILITRYRKQIYSYIVLLVKNQHLAEDIFQDTFIKVIRSLHEGRYRDDGKFLAWVVRIAHNLVIDHFRREKQMNSVSNKEFGMDIFNSKRFATKTIEDEIIHEQIEEDIRNLVDYLPDDQREVLVLRHYCGLSFKEIADQTHVSINTALGRMRYALINLRKLVKEKNLTLSV
ncbi:MAG: sigma-70 family RNA polymerase sigma factor [Bacteroidales bacterium]|nr:sigma-70 family RNA polymerase sigma factor [Bacteroidales bacterium]MBN2763661.1 sigma-70 family RNA polymerase sigma factor [Bacteroidales bacterium]